MRYPDFLKENGTIHFIAPSFGCATEPYITMFDNALKKFSELGYKYILGPNSRAANGIGISNSPDLCGKELNEAYTDDSSDAIISCGGGELMCEVVPYMDFDLIGKSRPKWYMGYSDNTNFTFLSATLADTAAIYSPCASSFGMEPWHSSINDAMDLVTGKSLTVHGYDMWEYEDIFADNSGEAPSEEEENPLAPYDLNRKTEYKYFIPGDGAELIAANDAKIEIEGRLLGGCMDCLENLIGTKFDRVSDFADRYKDDGIIWFMEACDLNVMTIRRTLWHMKNAGWFKNLKGFLIGRPLHFGEEMMGLDQYNAVTGVLAEYGVPVLMDLDIGHLPPMMPLITGAYAHVRASENSIEIEHILK
jgi:muramoyltetrapeptide carboxypeptidase LdcA involved in peptidoglycan recycling